MYSTEYFGILKVLSEKFYFFGNGKAGELRPILMLIGQVQSLIEGLQMAIVAMFWGT